jgi:serine/threonine protein kinase
MRHGDAIGVVIIIAGASRPEPSMTTVRLTCPEGHVWEHPQAEPIPSDLRTICPICALDAHTAAHESSAQPGPDSATGSSGSRPGSSGAATTAHPGQVVAGFEIMEELNRGGMGVIYKARQIAMNRLVALKAINPFKLEQPGARERFMSEVRASAVLNHQNIVQVYHTDLDGPFPYLAMEYVPGIDLLRLVRKVGPLPVADAVYYIRQAAIGLQHAYEKGLVHRDIKPSNLMVTPGPIGSEGVKGGKLPKVKILDMGLARVLSPEGRDEDEGLTQTGVFLGTPDYVSPEQAEDPRRADIRSDIYSLGGSLYYLLTGEVPFPGKSIVEKLRKALTEQPPSAAAKRKDVPPAVNAVLRKMMTRDPAKRYQTPVEVMAALDRAMKGELPSDEEEADAEPIPTPLATVRAHAGAVRSMAVAATPDGPTLVTAGDDSRLRLWQPATLQEVKTFLADLGAVEQLVIAPNGKRAATCAIRLTTAEMGVQLWDLATGAEQRRLRGPADNIRCVAIAPDSKAIVAGSDDGMVWLWTSDTGGPKTVCMRGHAGSVTGVAFVSADSLLTAGTDGTVRQWELKTGKSKGTIPAGVGPLVALAYGGKRLAVAGDSLALRMPTGQFVKLEGHDGPVLCCAISADGRLLVSGGADRTVRVWSTEEGTTVTTFPGHTGPVRAVAIDPGCQAIFSGGEDGMLRRWAAPKV